MQIARNITLFLLLALLVGCSGNSPNSGGSKEVVISSLLKEAGLGENITRIALVVSGEGFEATTHELDIIDGVATITIDVPIGEARTFEMTAFNNTDVALYRGSSDRRRLCRFHYRSRYHYGAARANDSRQPDVQPDQR